MAVSSVNGGAKEFCDDYEFDLEAYPAAAEFLSFVRDDIVRQVLSLGKKQSDLYVPLTERILRTMGGFGGDSRAFNEMYRNEMVMRTIFRSEVGNNIVNVPPSTEGDVFVARTALVRCGTFVDVCELEDEGASPQHSMMALVLDYDVLMVNGRRMKKNHPRGAHGPPKIRMFSELTAERRLVSAMFARLNPNVIRLAIHNPHVVSVMYDSKKYPDGMAVKDLLGHIPDHMETMEALETMPGDFNTWTFPAVPPLTPEEDDIMDFIEDELEFQEDDQMHIAKWVVYTLLQLEKGVTDSVAIMTDSMFTDLWACTCNVECAAKALEMMTVKCGWENALVMFNTGRFKNGEVIINPLTYNPRMGVREPCWVGPVTAFLDNMRNFFGRGSAPLHDNMGLEGNYVRHFEEFMWLVLLSPDGRVKDKLRTLKALVHPNLDDVVDQEPERAVAIKKSRCAVCLSPLDTAGPHCPCALPCGHIFGHRCAVKLTQCDLCKAVVGHPCYLRTLYLNCFEYTDAKR